MIKIIVGPKGSGKTSRMVDQLNTMATDQHLNVACIERGKRLDQFLKPQIRLIDVSEYPVASFKELLSFIAGIAAKDFDMNELFIESIYKVAKSDSIEELTGFAADLDKFSSAHEFNATILLSAEMKDLSDELVKFCS
jgi:hypothetical protein